MPGKTQVTIAPGFAVFVHGEQVTGGNDVDVDPDTAANWIKRGWATEASNLRRRRPSGPHDAPPPESRGR